ncbi:hypothetical protein SAMN02745216_04256 [Desulfatibacillum alkenivorans DSM 16219]|jgi:uncharacterized membrane protein (DUF2068 family)|uniref:ATP-binding protein n=1 Tax=Desulfatibacillum alkenivorans DSM 16219 TaxID=1121393 RepID=A0A1M6W5P9_9BACT|nr:ATP-binding protein [Desulfatibacillum alkenivorans]SHK89084.1 hypothetical protein SAMN02745216_04256 [Desulfatibacillum alkenivorans DSM 16219]
MSTDFHQLKKGALNQTIAAFLCPRLQAVMESRGPGHCMRVADLADPVMEAVCAEMRKARSEANIFVLAGHDEDDRPNRVTSTKLVELRNPLPDGQLRQPLLVFVPNSLRTSAEDSFGIATFEELTFTEVYSDIIQALLERTPASLTGSVRDVFSILAEENWFFADDVSKVRYLLTALENGVDGETLGASLYELSLVPDFKLFADLSQVNGRIRKNNECVQSLAASHKSVRGRLADLNLSDKSLRNSLVTFFDRFPIHEPETWTRPIALEKNWRGLSFDKWKFKEDFAIDKIRLSIRETDLPVVREDEKDERLATLIGQQVLVPNERRKMNVVFEVTPHPSKVSGLDHFTVQIVSQTGGPAGKAKKVKAWKPKRTHSTVGLTKLNKIDFEEGWHFIRVLPWTEDGDPIPIEGASDLTDSAARPWESEPFYVLPDGAIEEEPPQRAIPIEISVEHARLRLQFTALNDDRDPAEIQVTGVHWAEGERVKKSARHETLIAKFGREGSMQIPVSRALKIAEQRMLATPEHPSGWRMQINMDSVEPPSQEGVSLPGSSALQSFLAARTDFFEAVRQGKSMLITQGYPMDDAQDRCIAYAETYLDLIDNLTRQAEATTGNERQTHLNSLRNVLATDSIRVILTDFRGRHKEAILVSPTHPLRALWFQGWHRLGQHWVSQIKPGTRDHVPGTRHALLERIHSTGFPVCVPAEDGRIFTPIGNLTPFWSLYSPTTEIDPRALLAEVCSAFGLPEPSAIGVELSGNVLADKIDRYLSQHPYVRELSINIFNPGSGSIIAEALIALQQRREYSDLRYDIRMFAHESESPVLGESFESLLNPISTVTEAADAFCSSTGNHLFSKLNIAKHNISEFHQNPKRYAAHISVLLDVFPAEELGVIQKSEAMVPLHGLIQDYETDFVDDETGTYWHKSPVIGQGTQMGEGDHAFDLIARISRNVAWGASAVAASGASFRSVPMVSLGLDVPKRELIYEIHQTSDWVFTVDRHMGIEFFDHGGRKNRPDYLIDFVPGINSNSAHNLIISSRSTSELEAMLRPVLDHFGLHVDGQTGVEVLSQLRSLSGQLALKLISASTQQAEALGLALARMYLEYQGALSNQIIMPLDAHVDLYRSASEPDDVTQEINLQRTDLALFDLDFSKRLITCNLVEVKCYSTVGDFSAFNQLKERIAGQINQSERILQRHFDPSLKHPDRPDRLLKNRELSQILRFYLERAVRYGIFDDAAQREATEFLATMENGYTLQFRRSALIFDFEKTGTNPAEKEVGIEYHRIGKDLIVSLLTGCSEKRRTPEKEEAVSLPTSLSTESFSGVPKLEEAAFLVQERMRSTSTGYDVDGADAQPDMESSAPTSTVEPIVDEEQESPDSTDRKKEAPVENQNSDENTNRAVDEASAPEDDEPPEQDSVKADQEPKHDDSTHYDVILGVDSGSPQYGVLGEISSRKIAIDLNQTHTMSLFGVQGGGKSYTLGTVIEMATMPIPNINVLPSPLATVLFHYSPTREYSPEFTSMILPNQGETEAEVLASRYGAQPRALKDVLILTPRDKLEERREEFPGIEVRPIAFSASELKASHWKFLMGAIGSQSMYLRQINLLMRGLRDRLTLEALRSGIEESNLSDHLKELAFTRLQFAGEYIDDTQKLQNLIRPGRLIIVDLRDEYIEKDEALGLFVVMLQIFSEATYQGQNFNKLVVFDEAHKYIENDDLISGLVEVVREMRHKGTSIMVASQDPPSVPISLIELSSHIILHKFNSPAWLKHIQKANASLSELTPEKMSHLTTGEAYVWASKSSDDAFIRGAVKIKCRPRVTQHGGATKTAVGKEK